MTSPETSAQSASAEHTLPERYRAAQFATFESVMSKEWLVVTGQWLHSQRGLFTRAGDDGRGQFNYELREVDDIHAPFADLRAALTARLTEAVKRVGVSDFDLDHIECHASLYHHGSHYAWHSDKSEGGDTRRLAYALYMHTDPRMFAGGELEFLDGTTVDASHNRLVVFEPGQQHRVRRVECWSADFLHGRWAVFGWIHGRPENP